MESDSTENCFWQRKFTLMGNECINNVPLIILLAKQNEKILLDISN